MKLKSIFIAILGALLLSSCSAIHNYVNMPVMIDAEPDLNAEWIGRPYSEIIRSYGAPTRTADDGIGGLIHVYEQLSTTSTTTTSSNTTSITPSLTSETRTETHRQFTEFYVDSNNNCYLVRTNTLKDSGMTRFSPTRAAFLVLVASAVIVPLMMVATQ